MKNWRNNYELTCAQILAGMCGVGWEGGGSHNLGYHALRWEMILHGNTGEMGKYAAPCCLIRLLVFCMSTIIHPTPLWACLRFPWTGVISVYTAFSDQIRY
jgi:hypothetical protein